MIVDNDLILSELKNNYSKSENIVIPIYSDINKHRLNNRVSVLYIYSLNTTKEYIIPIYHSDKIFSITDLSFLHNSFNTYTYSSGIKNSINIDALYYMTNLCNIRKEELYTPAHKFYYNKYLKNTYYQIDTIQIMLITTAGFAP